MYTNTYVVETVAINFVFVEVLLFIRHNLRIRSFISPNIVIRLRSKVYGGHQREATMDGEISQLNVSAKAAELFQQSKYENVIRIVIYPKQRLRSAG